MLTTPYKQYQQSPGAAMKRGLPNTPVSDVFRQEIRSQRSSFKISRYRDRKSGSNIIFIFEESRVVDVVSREANGTSEVRDSMGSDSCPDRSDRRRKSGRLSRKRLIVDTSRRLY